jgi:hypothetical protein
MFHTVLGASEAKTVFVVALQLNRHGTWNVGGTWGKGAAKIKHLRTSDGYDLSRARMRRDKRRWRQNYGDLPPQARAPAARYT